MKNKGMNNYPHVKRGDSCYLQDPTPLYCLTTRKQSKYLIKLTIYNKKVIINAKRH